MTKAEQAKHLAVLSGLIRWTVVAGLGTLGCAVPVFRVAALGRGGQER